MSNHAKISHRRVSDSAFLVECSCGWRRRIEGSRREVSNAVTAHKLGDVAHAVPGSDNLDSRGSATSWVAGAVSAL
jgi:hypothetical protein